MAAISDKTIGRLSLYRRLLAVFIADDRDTVCSRELAELARGTPAQVRRDLMIVGCPGRPSQGYDVRQLIERIGTVLDAPDGENVALVGIGNLGRAVLTYLAGRRPNLTVAAAFDIDPQKINHAFRGCPCWSVEQIPRVVRERGIRVGIIAVPAANAQAIAEALVAAGVRGLLNFAPVRLHVPDNVFTVDMDISMSLETAAYFARFGNA